MKNLHATHSIFFCFYKIVFVYPCIIPTAFTAYASTLILKSLKTVVTSSAFFVITIGTLQYFINYIVY